jgi:hypothetical protein
MRLLKGIVMGAAVYVGFEILKRDWSEETNAVAATITIVVAFLVLPFASIIRERTHR